MQLFLSYLCKALGFIQSLICIGYALRLMGLERCQLHIASARKSINIRILLELDLQVNLNVSI